MQQWIRIKNGIHELAGESLSNSGSFHCIFDRFSHPDFLGVDALVDVFLGFGFWLMSCFLEGLVFG